MKTERIKNFKILLSIILFVIILDFGFVALLQILNPNLIIVVCLLIMITNIIKDYTKLLLKE